MTTPIVARGAPRGDGQESTPSSRDAALVETAPQVARETEAAVERLARWLLAAVVLDLLVTRFVVRLAMFIPKGEPWASMARALGRVGAATDVLVPLVGVLLLGALALRVSRHGPVSARVAVAATGGVALGGFALVVLPPSPGLVLGIALLVAVAAMAAAPRFLTIGPGPRMVRAGLLAVTAAIVLAASGTALGAGAALARHDPIGSGMAAVVAQVAFVTGAALLGVSGIRAGRAAGAIPRRLVVAACLVTLVALAAWLRSAATWDSLSIWSVGLSGAVPGPLVALVLGLVIVGLPLLHRAAPMVAVGAATVLASGVGLAASGLVLSGLLGLIVAGTPGAPDDDQSAALPGS